jgi:hypothetical protein
MSHRATAEGAPITKEYIFSDYKEFAGTPLPTREIIRHDGKKISEIKYTDYKPVERPDPGTFDRP